MLTGIAIRVCFEVENLVPPTFRLIISAGPPPQLVPPLPQDIFKSVMSDIHLSIWPCS